MKRILLHYIILVAFTQNSNAQWQWADLYSYYNDTNVDAVSGWNLNTPAYAVSGTHYGLLGFSTNFNTSFILNTTNSIFESDTITCLSHSFPSPGGNKQAIGTLTGVYLYDVDSNIWMHFNSSNSGLPNDTINYLLASGPGFWIATNGGLAFLNITNQSWTVLTTSNSSLPSNRINSIMFKNVVPAGWFISTTEGVAFWSYSDSTWKIFNTANSGLPENDIVAMIWAYDEYYLFATRSHGVADSLNDGTWVYYNSSNGLPSDSTTFIGPGTFLIGGDTWIGTKGGGLVYFEDGAPIESVDSVNGVSFRDANDAAFSMNFETATAWVATDKGLLVQDFGYGVPSITNEIFPLSALIDDNNLLVTFNISSSKRISIKLFDLLGRELAYSKQEAASGSRTVQMTIPFLSTGIYIVNVSSEGLTQSLKVLKEY